MAFDTNPLPGIIFSIIAPLIIVFSIVSFSLFWIVFRYNLLYVLISHHDTHGRLYPNALNQLFTGIYVMEICLVGLFLLVRDNQQRLRCIGQAIVMILATGLTVTFQVLLNRAIAPLLQFLSVVTSDQGLESGYCSRTQHESEKSAQVRERSGSLIETQNHSQREQQLCPRVAFKHEALRFQRPVVWIPKDDVGISDDELYQTKKSYAELSISNDRARLNSDGRLVIEGNPPNFLTVA